ncbi:MAG: YdcF family protein [Legionella sp.]|nr:YdcF family protein [Legionella sp.]
MAFFRHLMEALINPYFLTLVLFAFLLIKFYQQKCHRRYFWGFSLIFLLSIVFSTGWVSRSLTSMLEAQYNIIDKPDASIHWIVVLSGGQAQGKNQPANMLLASASIERLVEGVRLYRQLPDAKLLLSGGGYNGDIAESTRMATLTKWFAIPAKNIVLETASTNTASQAKEIKKMVHQDPFYLVTSAIHMRRAMLLCQAQGLNPVAAPSNFTGYWQDERWEKMYLPNPHNLSYLNSVLHELYGMAWSGVI